LKYQKRENDNQRLIQDLLDRLRHHPGDIAPRHSRKHMSVLRIRENHPTWCGPVAVAFVTGCTVNDAAQLYANVRNRNVGALKKYGWMKKSSTSLSGVYPGETWEVLNLLGYEMEPIKKAKGITVAALLDRSAVWMGWYRPDDKLMVLLPQHYVVAHRFLVSDNSAQHVPASEHPYGNRRIDDAWRVFEKPYAGDHAMTG